MDKIERTTERIQEQLDNIVIGDHMTYARNELLVSSQKQIRYLVRSLLTMFSVDLLRWEGEDDLVQDVLLRVDKAVLDAKPKYVGQFFIIVGFHVRWELINKIKHYYGPHGIAANHQTGNPRDLEPGKLKKSVNRVVWLSDLIETLPNEQQEIIHLRVFAGLTREVAAEVLGISTKTVTRIWKKAIATLINEADRHGDFTFEDIQATQ